MGHERTNSPSYPSTRGELNEWLCDMASAVLGGASGNTGDGAVADALIGLIVALCDRSPTHAVLLAGFVAEGEIAQPLVTP